MPEASLKLMGVFAHPDDETLGFGGALARYSEEGVDIHVVTATRGEAGRYGDGTDHPGPEALGEIREGELLEACEVLGVGEVDLLGYPDGGLASVDPVEARGTLVRILRRSRPQVVVTFGPDGAYGHPDHIAISQLATAATVAAADPGWRPPDGGEPDPVHAVSKLYYLAWGSDTWAAYQAAFKTLTSTVDGVERQATPWPEWAITTRVDASEHWRVVWKAVQCHRSQIAVYGKLGELDESYHRTLWGAQHYYRVFSTVNGGRDVEDDFFEGLRG